MPILKKKITSDFTVVHNAFVRDEKLGATARGVLITMISMPENWKFSIKGLSAILPDGERKIGTALKELEKLGYLIRKRIYVNGKVSEWNYIFSDEPMEHNEDKSDSANSNDKPTKQNNTKPDSTTSNYSESSSHVDQQNLDLRFVDVGFVDVENVDDYQINNNQILKESSTVNINPIHPTQPFPKPESSDRIDADGYTEALETISEQVDAASLLQITNRKTGMPMYDSDAVQELVELIAWVYTTPQKTMPINGVALSIDIIRSQFHKLDSEHLTYVLDSLRNNCAKIKNRRNYLLTCLFNAPSTMSGYYQNQVQHNLSITDAIESRSSPNVYAQLVEKN
ncbi:DUF6017 domain-containing protein [Ruminococcus sp.]|uniref:DUF6017 domain-containing protein n=1 Tax=Ruminococcus sp. TaxID=41978 RepID=UPI0025E4C84E|nr:DUF6017 domain-containing protein [Ruminococcus sp.]